MGDRHPATRLHRVVLGGAAMATPGRPLPKALPGRSAPGTLRVVATNILHGNSQAPEGLARLVDEWLPDVVIVCEVVREAGAALAGELPSDYQAVHVADPCTSPIPITSRSSVGGSAT